MNTKELCIELDKLRTRELQINKLINTAVYNYLKETVGIEKADVEASDDIIGKIVDPEWHWCCNNKNDSIIIYYSVFRNKWGDISDREYQTEVTMSVLDKYYQ